MSTTRKLLAASAALAAVGGAALGTAGPAAAARRDGVCNSGEFCYYYNSNGEGAVSDFTTSVDDYGTTEPSCYDFKGTAAGHGICVKNNAASVRNNTGQTVTVYFNSNYGGHSQQIPADGAVHNLDSTLKNNNASHSIGTSSGGTAQTPRNDYDGNARGFAQDNCTAFAAYRIASRLGHPAFNDDWDGQHWGDAQHWDDAARAAGFKVDTTPVVGGIVVNDVHHSSSDGILHGHVAYINRVYSDGSFDVEEYNWNVHLGYGTRSHLRISSADAAFQHVIHF